MFTELTKLQRHVDKVSDQMRQAEQVSRELRSQESDLLEALGAKDSQLAVLRVRYEEATNEVTSQKRLMDELQFERNRYCFKIKTKYPLFLNQYKVLKNETHLESFRVQPAALDHSTRGCCSFQHFNLFHQLQSR